MKQDRREGVARVVTRGPARKRVCSVSKVHRRAWPKDRGPFWSEPWPGLGPVPALNGPDLKILEAIRWNVVAVAYKLNLVSFIFMAAGIAS